MRDVFDDLFSVRKQIAALKIRENELREEAHRKYGTGFSDAKGIYLVRITPYKRFDSSLAKRVLSEEQLTQVSVMEAKSDLVRSRFPFEFEKCQKESGFTVSVEINPDLAAESLDITV